MRRAVLFCAALAFAAACGDGITESIPDRTTAVTPPVSFATTTTENGLSISTDKDDYAPGDTVHFTGTGWTPGNALEIVLVDDAATQETHQWTVSVAEDGTFHDSTYVVDTDDIGVTFTLKATDLLTEQSLTVVFRDGNITARTNASTVTITVSWRRFNGSSTCSGASTSGATPNVSNSAVVIQDIVGSQSLEMTAPATAGGRNFVSWTSGATTVTTLTFCVAGANNVQNWIANYAAANAAPNAPATLGQFKSNGATSIATGGATDETSAVLKASVSDPDAGNTVKLQVEVRPVGTAFSNTSTAESGLLSSGSTASVAISSLINGTRYHWQARTVDNSGAPSAWVSFGGNTEADTDFRILADRPSATIDQQSGQADPTNSSPVNFTVVFSEAVTGFTNSDVTLSGTAGATTATVTGSGTTYTVAVSGMTGDGTVMAAIAAGVASDDAGNTNLASTSTDNEVSYDNTPPTVTINQAAGQDDPTKTSPINFTVLFSEPVSDFATGDVTLGGTALATTQLVTGSGTTYNVAVSGMTTDGTVTASVAAGKATDGVGNPNTVSTSSDNTVTYDATAPLVSCGSADGVWHAADVSIACSASDAVSGLANPADASFNLVTNVGAGTETNNASTDSRLVADLAGNSVTAGPISGNMIDKKAPVVSLTCPLTPVILGTSAVANWTAVDGGSEVAAGYLSGSIALATSSVGQKQATAGLGTSRDNVGNQSAAVSCSYRVIYRWAGFFQPVDNNNLNVAKAGSAIPVKFSLNGNQGLAIFMSGSPSSTIVSCGSVYTSLDTVEQTVTAGGSTLTYDASTGQYIYVWKTVNTWVGQCRRLDVKLIDGTVHVAYFRFK